MYVVVECDDMYVAKDGSDDLVELFKQVSLEPGKDGDAHTHTQRERERERW